MRPQRLSLVGICCALVFGVAVARGADKPDGPPPRSIYPGDGAVNKLDEVDLPTPGKGLSGPHFGPAGVPANDLCTNAQVVGVPSSTPGTTVDSTFDGVATCGTANTTPGVWYTFTPASSGLYRASTCNQANFDSKISVFSGSCGALGCVGGNDDGSGCGLTSRVDFLGIAGQPLLVLVHGFGGATGDFTLDLSYLQALVAGDLCQDAIPVATPSVTSGSTVGATVDTTTLPCGTSITAPGLWYEVIGTGNALTVDTCTGTSYDSKISVYCQDCATPTCIGGNDDACGLQSRVQWDSEPGASYKVLVHGFSEASGSFDLTVTDTGVPSTNPVACYGPIGACCDPTSAGCTQTDEYLCAIAGGTFAAGLPCYVPIPGQSYSNFPGLAIPDDDTTGVTDTITVSDSFPVQSVIVDVGITHSFIGDLRLRLEHAGTSQVINMFDRRCGSTDNLNTRFIDGGATTNCFEVSLPGGQVDPTVAGLGPAFSSLAGVDSASDWRLTVDDGLAFDRGTFDSWTLHFAQPVCYAYPNIQEIPTMDRKGLAALALLLAGAAALLIWRRRG